ncbi:MAG: restriction endonuclease, partial [Campylobacterota bacterium]|nr:restriction endonuclease [Campylobacterota bacterium]
MTNIIYEYQELCKDNHKDLITHIKNNTPLHKYFKEDWGKLKAQQYCGIINYDGEDFYILPKIANYDNDVNLNIFVYMLMYAFNINVKNEDLANAQNHQSNNILEVFIQMFAKNLFQQLQKGIYKEYVTEQDNLTVLRGKYLINENLKYNFTKSKIYCEYDEFSMNNELNQFFLYAIKTLMNYTKNKKLLKMCELVFDEVEFKQFDINNLHIHFNRLNNRFKDSFEFALLLLKKSIPMFDNGKKNFAFLFDMNELFEDFIGNVYKNIDSTTKLQNERNFRNLKLIPDIVCNDLIIDVKYKLAKDKGDLKRDDKYQMFVYGTNFDIKDTMLLYPEYNNIKVNEDLKLGKDDKMVGLKM